ncbi:hypothetical protein AYO22_07869 [Fonsecaea multimorphosa]|nr:hypothetical protein AYO22_07869 [Fonsecaea multimorphosa]
MAILVQGAPIQGSEDRLNTKVAAIVVSPMTDQEPAAPNRSTRVEHAQAPIKSQNEIPAVGPAPPAKLVEPTPTEAYREKSVIAYELSKLPFKTPRQLKVIMVGAGVSALSFAHDVKVGRLQNIELQILEKNAGLGGTWFENRYPGCACDIPSHNYLFSWAPNPDWSSYYVTAPEILKYLEDTTDKFDLRKYITLCRKVVGARWLAERQKWQIISRQTDGRRNAVSSFGISDGEVGEEIVDECDIFINASGFFNHWRWPALPGRESFKGTIVHSANYDPSIDLRNKRVAVIGNGSSGIQVTTAVQKVASHVSVFVRNPTYITANFGSKYIPDGGKDLLFSQEQKDLWRKDPQEYLRFRKAVEKELNIRFGTYIRGTPQQRYARETTVQDMRQRLASKPELAELLIPDFALGCRRPTPGTGYLEALCSPNCEVVWGELRQFTETGIESANGTKRDFDVIICATGFDISFVPRWSIIGSDNIDLRSSWAKNPACYMSCVAPDIPNYFTYLGPGSPVGAGSLITAIERVTLYISDILRKLQTENYSSFQLKAGKAEAYREHMHAWLEKTVWKDNCSSALKNGRRDAPLDALYPGSRAHLFELLKTRRYEDFDWVSRCPESELAFAWLNNGFLEHEYEYNDDFDDSWYLNELPPM